MQKRKNKIQIMEWVSESILLVLMIFLSVNMILTANTLQGNARVINYAGIVRGATQRLIKLEISDMPNDELIEELDTILEGLKNGGTIYKLTRMDDPAYQSALAELAETWEMVKEEIYKTREIREPSPGIIALSETYFQMADKTVALAERYSDGTAAKLRRIERVLIFLLSILLGFLIYKSVSAVRLAKKNKELERISKIDSNTGLPNKGYCEEMILRYGTLDSKYTYGCIMFDLNNLKKVNDQLGHRAGDELIKRFADTLAACAGLEIFVGRYGGDEFIAIMPETSEGRVEDFVHRVEEAVKAYNEKTSSVHVKYACGSAVSSHNQGTTMYELLAIADQKMYVDKAEKKRVDGAGSL